MNCKIHILDLNLKAKTEKEKNIIEIVDRLKQGVDILYYKKFERYIKEEFKSNPEIKNQLDENKKVVCFVHSGNCQSCVIRILQDLSIMEEEIGKKCVIFCSDIGSKEHPYMINEFDFPAIHVNPPLLLNQYIKEPLIFILDKQMNIELLFFPESFSWLKQSYFNEILPYSINSK